MRDANNYGKCRSRASLLNRCQHQGTMQDLVECSWSIGAHGPPTFPAPSPSRLTSLKWQWCPGSPGIPGSPWAPRHDNSGSGRLVSHLHPPVCFRTAQHSASHAMASTSHRCRPSSEASGQMRGPGELPLRPLRPSNPPTPRAADT